MQNHLRKYLYRKAAAARMPISGTFELTPRCNMRCRMCYIQMPEDRKKQELSADPPARVNVTLYGGSNDTYRHLCGHPAGFDAATNALELMKEAGLLLHINSSFTCCNLQDMGAILDFGKSQGIRTSAATYMFPPVRNDRNGKCDGSVRFGFRRNAGAAP